MDYNDLSKKCPGNSKTTGRSTNTERPKTKKIITGGGRVKEKGFFTKFVETFVGMPVEDVAHNLIQETVVPAIKNTVLDSLNNGFEMLLYGETSHRSKNKSGYKAYSSYYDNKNSSKSSSSSRRSSRYGVKEYLFEKKQDAIDVLDDMRDMIAEYDEVSVSNYYGLIGLTQDFTDEEHGWRNLDHTRIFTVRDAGETKYGIDLPRTEDI